MNTQEIRRRSRGAPGLRIVSLPYKVKVYINNQVLVPASLVRALGITNIRYANITLAFNGARITINGVKLLRTRHTDSRQFTIPKDVRDAYGIKPGDVVEIIEIRPYRA
ncbi:AbrB/MazE/SpoVT family DNA-binding domain-containing protein [Vulcanisaeta thermophila]|uniref:AbrB/MazE/SpoVT family DNA-binding domain-containing protein n=1 Tax=Vulcanisaeta thermophila TaxID=867917 RepID=UPI00085357B4|nr:AbrB/MazE/SpoVT family DNA-binding domain-containing protein [Vulcanisaeta thermophila]